jgi:ATP-binding cassette subfamily B (MDR/TAP) protein 1
MSGGSGISTAFTNMRTVSAFSMHHTVSEHYSKLTRKIAAQRTERSVVAAIGFGASNSMQYFVYALLFWYGSQLLLHEGLSFENLMISIMTLMMGAIGLGSALRNMGDQTEAAEIASRVFSTIEDSLKSPIDGLSIQGKTPSDRAVGKIELKNVSFRYPTRPNIEVCKGYTITIEAGETVALVGPSGSGKVIESIIFMIPRILLFIFRVQLLISFFDSTIHWLGKYC